MNFSGLTAWIREHHGIAHTSTLYAAGFAKHVVARAVNEGECERIRRSWIAVPDCAQPRKHAVAEGGRLTCVSAAQQHGLWVQSVPDRTHIAVRRGASRIDRAAVHAHWSPGPAPVGRYETDEPLLNVLHHVAQCLPFAEALAVWESAVRQGHVTRDELRRVRWRAASGNLLAQVVSELSDAGTETRFLMLMREIGVTVRQQVRIAGHAVDGLIGEYLVIQLDGFAHHSTPRDRRRDLRHDARLAAAGYTVLRFDYRQLFFEGKAVQETVRTAMAQQLHRAR
ncbi:DUF559 domain-containing protein [Microbacterium sp. YY-01]|uniref:DUF559 domain-containing protein n=1 Tax=Microbacterium sp. YY-01 TaxID=3421634 RepID=UPI003D17296D